MSRIVATGAVIAVGWLGRCQRRARPRSRPPRTAWNRPDLQGVWDFRTITPMERPEALGDQAFLSAEDVADLEQDIADRDALLAARPAQRTVATNNVDRGVDGAPGAYNQFWMDRGTRVIGTRRTSLVVDPPNGRIPAMTAAGEQRRAAEREYVRDHPADSWADRSIYERCILGFNSGPPIEPRAYNNHMQVFQTPDHVVIFNEMVHDARIIPARTTEPATPSTYVSVWAIRAGDGRETPLVIETSNLDRPELFYVAAGGHRGDATRGAVHHGLTTAHCSTNLRSRTRRPGCGPGASRCRWLAHRIKYGNLRATKATTGWRASCQAIAPMNVRRGAR